jgi:hypothetical protein
LTTPMRSPGARDPIRQGARAPQSPVSAHHSAASLVPHAPRCGGERPGISEASGPWPALTSRTAGVRGPDSADGVPSWMTEQGGRSQIRGPCRDRRLGARAS